MRASSSVVSLNLRVKQFWKNAGIELLLITLLFFSLRHILYTGSTSDEGRHIAAQSLQLASGELSLKGGTPPPAETGARLAWQTSRADSVLIPLGIVSLLTGGGKTVLDLVTIALALLCIAGIYAAGKELFSPETGIAAAAFLPLIPAFMTHAAGLYALTFAYAYTALAIWLLARSRRESGRVALIMIGMAISHAIHAEPLFIYLLVFLALYWIESRPGVRQIGLVLGGFALSEIILAALFAIVSGAAPFGYLAVLFAPPIPVQGGAALAGGYTSLADLFEKLFTSPQVLPFSLLAVFAIGYTLRASKSSFPYQPLLLFCAAYFTLEFLPRSFDPFATIPKNERVLAGMAPAFALLLGTFFAGLSNRTTLRWFLAALNILALPLLLFY
jgi:4-amino-4-deoxy-L-arabinose transferase-like glycosyltransferase